MSNERFRNLKVGDRVFVYRHEKTYSRIVEVIATEIKASVIYPTPKEALVEAITISFTLIGETQKDNQSFYIRFSEEKSKRGTTYTGFLTIEDALEFAKSLKDQKIEELQKDIKSLEESYNKLLISFEK